MQFFVVDRFFLLCDLSVDIDWVFDVQKRRDLCTEVWEPAGWR